VIAATALVWGKVFSFEPSKENLWFLRKHVAWNSLDNVTVLPFALGAADGRSAFGGEGTGSGHLGGKRMPVLVRTVDSLLASGECAPPNLIKLDVEGAEADVLRGSCQMLATRRSTLVIATHGDPIHDECLQILRDLHYGAYHQHESSLIIAVSQTKPQSKAWAWNDFSFVS